MSERRNNLTEVPADLTLVLTRVFDAPRALVYDAWTKKEHLDKWCAPRRFTIPVSGADFRVDGKWHTLMIATNGEKYPLGGTYREIIPNELLVMTHCWEDDEGKPEHETILKVSFADEGKKTRVTLEQAVFKSVESRDGHKGGWTECFDILDELLVKLQDRAA